MARPKEFDKEIALEKAMRLFWRRGFAETSMDMLVSEMGISRSSFYQTFGDKRSLYVLCLNRYSEHGMGVFRRIMSEDVPVQQKFRAFFDTVVTGMVTGYWENGCLVANAAVEQAPLDHSTLQAVMGAETTLLKIFKDALVKASKDGEIESGTAEELALYFWNVFSGLRVVIKTTKERRKLQKIVDVALSTLEK